MRLAFGCDSDYGEARMHSLFCLIVFMPVAAILYLMSAREGTNPRTPSGPVSPV